MLTDEYISIAKQTPVSKQEARGGATPNLPNGIHLTVPANSPLMNLSMRSTADALPFKQLPTCTLVIPAMSIPNKKRGKQPSKSLQKRHPYWYAISTVLLNR